MALDITGNYMQLMSYHYILTDRDLLQKIDADFFNSKFLQTCYPVAKAYALKYMTPPSKKELLEELSRKMDIDEVVETQIDALYAQDINSVDRDYIHDMVINVATWQSTVNAHFAAGEYIKKNDSLIRENPNIAKSCREKVRNLIDQSLSVDYEEGDHEGFDFWNADSHRQDKLERRTTGYKFVDECMDGGYWDGSFTIFAGAPKVGKSQFLCNLCAESVLNGYNSLYITLELPEQMVIKRIGSNIFNIPHADYEQISNNQDKMTEVISEFRKKRLQPLGEFVVKSYPTSTMTAEDLEAYIIKEELKRSTDDRRFKFHNVFVDYINIMRNPNNEYTENTYVKIKNIAEHLKGIGVRNNWAIISATQTNKNQYDMSDISAKDVAESSGLGATVDMMFGIIKDDSCAINNQYYIKCIYDRVAPHMEEKKLYNFDGKYLRLKEDTNSGIVSCLVEKAKTVFENSYRKQPKDGVVPAPKMNNNGGVPNPIIAPVSAPISQPKIVQTLDLEQEAEEKVPKSSANNGNVSPRLYDNNMVIGNAPTQAPNISAYSATPTMPNDDDLDDDIIIEQPSKPKPIINNNPFANKNNLSIF